MTILRAMPRRPLPAALAQAMTTAAARLGATACGARNATTFSGGSPAGDALPQPNYYALLGVSRNATPNEIKTAFRNQAKLYHPDAVASRDPTSGSPAPLDVAGAASALETFKLINEAYSVLSDTALRRDYDSDRFNRSAMLRQRNEGWAPGDSSPARTSPDSYVAWDSSLGRPLEGGAGGAVAAEAFGEDAFRVSLARASARFADGQRARASAARVNRAKIDVPTKNDSWMLLAAPIGVVALWAFNYVVFMR